MATDQRGIDDEQSTQEGDQRSKRRRSRIDWGHRGRRGSPIQSHAKLDLTRRSRARDSADPPEPDVPHTVAASADSHPVSTSRNCVWLNTLIISALNWR